MRFPSLVRSSEGNHINGTRFTSALEYHRNHVLRWEKMAEETMEVLDQKWRSKGMTIAG